MHNPNLSGTVHQAIAAVCQIGGISIGDENDKTTWRIDFADGATEEQKALAAAALAAFDIAGAMKSELRAKVDADAERVRLRYITPGAGMAMTYIEKRDQANAVHGMGQQAANALTEQERTEQFPTLAASVGLEAQTLWDCAILVIQRAEAWATLSNAIERTRFAGKKAISDASDAAAARAAYEAITWPTP